MTQLASLPLPEFFRTYYQKFITLTPIQEKAVQAGLLEKKSLLICAPTASGKTLVATMAIAATLGKGKAIYLVPLKALANEKAREYQQWLEHSPYTVTVATGEIDSESNYLSRYDLLILTTEKFDALLRHQLPWLNQVKLVVVDEIHLLNDASRGPTLEIILTLLKARLQPQVLGLSATIGNPEELATWLGAQLVQDTWRPVPLQQGIHSQGKTEFFTEKDV